MPVEGAGPYWDLARIKLDLAAGVLDWELTPKAEGELFAMGWEVEDLDAFIEALHMARCRSSASQWCLEPQSRPASLPDTRRPRLADVYLMGYQRFTKSEQPFGHPKVYIKFTITEAPHRMLIYSIHHERDRSA